MKAIPRQPAVWTLGSNQAVVLADLPLTSNTRWVARRKAQVVAAVHSGILPLEDACARYALSLEEFMNWQIMAGRHVAKGQRTGDRKIAVTRKKQEHHVRDGA